MQPPSWPFWHGSCVDQGGAEALGSSDHHETRRRRIGVRDRIGVQIRAQTGGPFHCVNCQPFEWREQYPRTREVVVLDTDGSDQLNLVPENLHPEACLVHGGFTRPLNELCTVEEGYDTIFAVGRHTRVRQLGVLCHTYYGTEFDDLRVNGNTMTEAEHFRHLPRELG